MIPEAAVEAALNARLTFKNQRGMDNAANLMRHILEAAAPHMLAEAWELGRDVEYARSVMGQALTPNPYRANK